MSAYMMRQWKTASENISLLLEITPGNKEFLEFKKKINKRISEEKFGKFNFKEIVNQSKMDSSNEAELDIADFFDEKYLTMQAGERGKEIVAIQDIPKNTILIVSKAFTFSKFDFKSDLIPITSSNMALDTKCDPSKFENLKKLFKRVRGNPYLAKEIYSLYHGNIYNKKEAIPERIVDVGRLECIGALNWFKGEENQNIYSRLFDPSHNTKNEEKKLELNSGIWIKPSMICHSCVPNTFRLFYKDLMVVYSIKKISEGDKLTFSYVDPNFSLKDREIFLEKYHIYCKCERCQSETKIPKINEISDIIGTYPEFQKSRGDEVEINRIIKRLESLYPKNENYKVGLTVPYCFLSECYFLKGKYKEAAVFSEKAYDLHSKIDPICCMSYVRRIVNSYDRAGNLSKFKEWKSILEKDFWLFHELYGV